jgi:methyl-accepting chemotaxis protein
MTHSIGQVRDAAANIAAAIEEQGAATREIAATVQTVSGATQTAANAMSDLTVIADESGVASGIVLEAAEDIRTQTLSMHEEVDHFVAATRHAGDDRRQHERFPGKNRALTVRASQGGAAVAARIDNLSVGGAKIGTRLNLPLGAQVTLELDDGQAMSGRIVRIDPAATAIAFLHDETTMRVVRNLISKLMPEAA